MFEVRFLFEDRKRSKQDIETLYTTVELSSGDISRSANDATDCTDDKLWIFKSNMKMQSKECGAVITKDIAAALDRTKITDRQAIHLLAATAHGLGHCVCDLTPSRSSVRRAQKLHHVKLVTDIKNRFVPNAPLMVH